VDAQQRRREIVDAAIAVLAKQGFRGLTMKALAKELGGSVTLVTHYYRQRDDLIDDIADVLVGGWVADSLAFESDIEEPAERLRAFVHYLLPITEQRMTQERAYFMLLSASDGDSHVRGLLTSFDRQVRGLFRDHLRPLVAADALARTTDGIRALVLGVTLSAVEYGWSAKRQRDTVDNALKMILNSAPRKQARTAATPTRIRDGVRVVR
jgi:AcrR family transcriptional regulator